jgi:hypothetical protein
VVAELRRRARLAVRDGIGSQNATRLRAATAPVHCCVQAIIAAVRW